MNKAIKKIPKRGEIWLVDYNYKPKRGKEKELEIASKDTLIIKGFFVVLVPSDA